MHSKHLPNAARLRNDTQVMLDELRDLKGLSFDRLVCAAVQHFYTLETGKEAIIYERRPTVSPTSSFNVDAQGACNGTLKR